MTDLTMSGGAAQNDGMPDRDVLYRSLAGPWRRPCSLALRRVEPERLAASLEKALCRTLRDAGGCPGLREIGQVVWEAMAGDGFDSEARLERVLEATGTHQHTAIAVDVALGLIAGGRYAASAREASLMVAEVAAARITSQQFFGRGLRSRMLAEHGTSYQEVRDYELRCAETARFRYVGERLLADEGAAHLRAPRVARQDVPLPDLLAQPLGRL